MNEAIFREVNERIEDLHSGFAVSTGTLDIVCECSDKACMERIVISFELYERIRADATHFIVVPGHEREEVEAVVETDRSWLIVQKCVPVAIELAEETDPRS